MFAKFSVQQEGEILLNLKDIVWAGFTEQACFPHRTSWFIRLSNNVLELFEPLSETHFSGEWIVVTISFKLNHWVFIRPENISYVPTEVYAGDGRARVHLMYGSCLILDGQEELDDLLNVLSKI